MAIPDDKVQEVRDRVDIIDLIGRYVELRRAGRNYKGLCPFHPEKTPSFNVNPERKGYKCFGCGAGGDALRFVMDIEGKSFPEAVRKVAEICGVALPASAYERAGGSSEAHEKDDAYAICRRAKDLYATLLHEHDSGAVARAYLEQRGLGAEVVGAFGLGYAPAPSEGGWDTLVRTLEEARLPLPLAERLGLVGRSERSKNPYDKFRGRLMFPIVQPGGEVIAFSGRIVPPHDADDDRGAPPKYVNSPESLLFTKGKTLFGLAAARPAIRASRRAILVEGNVDVVKLHQWGHAETVAPLGTALTSDQARLLSRFADQAIMCFDGDTAGKKAAWAALPLLLEADLDVRMVLLPEGEDPDSVGPERFAALLDAAQPALEQMMIRIAAKAGTAAHARARGLDRVAPLILRVKRDSARGLYADRAAELFDIPAARVEAALSAAARVAAAPGSPNHRGPTGSTRGNRGQSEAGSGSRGYSDQRGRSHTHPSAFEPSSPHDPQENSRPIPSTSRGPVPVSAAVSAPADGRPVEGRPQSALPLGQAELTMLLVDLPHLASVAERTGALDWIRDARLRPIVEAVVEGAKRGENPTMDELLERVDPSAQRQVYGAVFEGRYRTGDAGATFDPQDLLANLVARCRIEELDHRIAQLDRDIPQAQASGFPDQARTLLQLKLQLRREQAALRDPNSPSHSAPSSESNPAAGAPSPKV